MDNQDEIKPELKTEFELGAVSGSADERELRSDEIDIVTEVKLPILAQAFFAMGKSLSETYGEGRLYVRQHGKYMQFFKLREDK